MINPETSFTANQSALPCGSLPQPLPHRKTESDNLVTDDSRVRREESTMGKPSITEKEMHSHHIIREILLKSTQKVVKHDINRISPQLQLYQMSKKTSAGHHSSARSAKASQRVKSIYKELQDQTPLWERVARAGQLKSKQKEKKGEEQEKIKNISIAGLTTYSFQSVKARYRLAYDPHGTSQEVSNSVKACKAKSTCSISRSEKIHFKTCPDEAAADTSLTQAITHNYEQMGTEEYLKSIHAQKENSEFIYGERLRSFSKISKLMALEGSDQETAEFTIQQIKMYRPTSKHFVKMGRGSGVRRARMNGDAAFEGRRMPNKQSKVIIRNILAE